MGRQGTLLPGAGAHPRFRQHLYTHAVLEGEIPNCEPRWGRISKFTSSFVLNDIFSFKQMYDLLTSSFPLTPCLVLVYHGRTQG